MKKEGNLCVMAGPTAVLVNENATDTDYCSWWKRDC